MLQGHVPPLVEWLPEQAPWLAVEHASTRDVKLATTAKHHGADYSLRILWEARRANMPISLGFAMCEKETGFRNIFGHDLTIFVGSGEVTEDRYKSYKRARDAQRPRRMQGVGPPQLTWYEFQDRADKLGGCWIEKHAIRVGMEVIGSYYNTYTRKGFSTQAAIILAGRDYNGNRSYGEDLYRHYEKWHKILN